MENLSFAYLVGLVFIVVGFVLILIAFPVRDKEQFRVDAYASPRPQLKLTIDSFLPGISLLGKVPRPMLILLVSHFMTCGSQLFVSCYSTLWSGITMLEDGPQEYNKTIINIVFDIGISWGNRIASHPTLGSLALCMSAILHLLTTLLLQQITSFTLLKYTYIVVNILAGSSLLFTWAVNQFYSIFVTLPFWGISMAVLQEIPLKLVNDIEAKVPPFLPIPSSSTTTP